MVQRLVEDVFNVALLSNTLDDYNTLVFANIETLNLTASETTASATYDLATVGLSISQTSVAAGGSGAAQTVNFLGTERFDIDTTIAAGTIDASGLSARLPNANGLTMSSATGHTKAQTITGSTGVDTIIGSTKGDTINTGAGNDIITGGTGADTIMVERVQIPLSVLEI